MQTDYLKQFEALSKSMMDAAVRFGEITSARAEKLARLNSEVLNQSLEDGVRYMQSLNGKQPEELMRAQFTYVNETGQKAVVNVQRYFQLFMDTNNELTAAMQRDLVRQPVVEGRGQAA